MKNTNTNTNVIANAIETYLKNEEWKYNYDEEDEIFDFGVAIDSPMRCLDYIIELKDEAYVVYAIAPLGINHKDEKMVNSMAKLLCQLNLKIKNGNFELDVRDGELRFKSFVDCSGVTPTQEMIEHSIDCPSAIFEIYAEELLDVIFSDMMKGE